MKTHNSPRTFEDLQPAARTPHTPFGVKAASGEAPSNPARRKFIGKVSGLAAAGLVAGAVALEPLAGSEAAAGPQEEHGGVGSPGANLRADRSLVLRVEAAQQERQVPIPAHPSNGDEQLFSNRIGNFSKGLPHNAIGEVDPAAYNSLLHALSTGNPQDFEDIIIGGDVGLVDPQSGLAFELEGTDSHQLALGPPPGVASAETASEAVENYWMALLRDVSFTNYGTDSGAQQAANELSGLPAFKGPRQGGRVTGQTLFRGPTPGDLIGPYLSQFLLLPFTYGAIPIQQRINTYLPL